MHVVGDSVEEELLTTRGNQLLVTGGFRFTVQRRLKDDSVSVLCADRSRKRCSARVIIRNGVIVRVHNGVHTHLPSPGKTAAIRVKSNIREKAVTSNKTSSAVVSEENLILSPEEMAFMPTTNSLKRLVQRRRQSLRRKTAAASDILTLMGIGIL